MKKIGFLLAFLLAPVLAFGQSVSSPFVYSSGGGGSGGGGAATSIMNNLTTCVSGAVGRLLYTAAGLAVKCDATSPQWDPATGTLGATILTLPGDDADTANLIWSGSAGLNGFFFEATSGYGGLSLGGQQYFADWAHDITRHLNSWHFLGQDDSNSGLELRTVGPGGSGTAIVTMPESVSMAANSGANGFYILSENGPLHLVTGGNVATNERWYIDFISPGNFLAATDGGPDIGASGANRPNNIYAKGLLTLGTGPTVVSNADGTIKASAVSGAVASATISASTSGNAATATALSANGSNCSSNQFPKGIDASGNAEGCVALVSGDLPSVIAPSTLTVGTGGTTLTLVKKYAPSLTPAASLAAIGATEQTFTVSGLTTNDIVTVNGPAPTALCPMVAARVSATDTLALTFSTLSALACTPAAGTYNVLAVRS